MKNETARREIESLDYYLQNHTNDYSEESHTAMMLAIDALSKPQEPKTGHWEQYGNSWEDKFMCSECGKEQPKILCGERIIGHWSDYCPYCGAKMIDPQESEEQE